MARPLVGLFEARKRKGWTQAQLADRIGKTDAAITMYERGDRRPSIDVLRVLARELETTTDDLLRTNDSSQPPIADPATAPEPGR